MTVVILFGFNLKKRTGKISAAARSTREGMAKNMTAGNRCQLQQLYTCAGLRLRR
jgi:hypothetical protein